MKNSHLSLTLTLANHIRIADISTKTNKFIITNFCCLFSWFNVVSALFSWKQLITYEHTQTWITFGSFSKHFSFKQFIIDDLYSSCKNRNFNFFSYCEYTMISLWLFFYVLSIVFMYLFVDCFDWSMYIWYMYMPSLLYILTWH